MFHDLEVEPEDLPVVRDLVGLLDENDDTSSGYTDLKFKSTRMPPPLVSRNRHVFKTDLFGS